jgi:hypothetical protein
MKKLALGVVVLGLMASPVFGQTAAPSASQAPAGAPGAAPKPEAAPSKRTTVTTGMDQTSAYLFRGIFQEDTGAILQPYVDVGVTLGKGVSVNFGNWESHHSARQSNWYESDYYASMTATAGKWKPGVLFTSYTSPKDYFKTVNELAGVLAYDDSAHTVPFSPKIILAQELTDGQADGGAHKGTYLELGIRPTVKIVKSKTPVNLAIPVKTGLSLHNYYELGDTSNAFGYLDTGAIISVPVSTKHGTWEFHGGVDVYSFGDNLKAFNSGDRVKPVVSGGFSYVY